MIMMERMHRHQKQYPNQKVRTATAGEAITEGSATKQIVLQDFKILRLHWDFKISLVFQDLMISGVSRHFTLPGHWVGTPLSQATHIHMPIFI